MLKAFLLHMTAIILFTLLSLLSTFINVIFCWYKSVILSEQFNIDKLYLAYFLFLIAACTAGTYADAAGVCQKCPVGTYQDQQGQYSCNPCPPQTWTYTTGAFSVSQCYRKSLQYNSWHDASKCYMLVYT